MHAIAAPEAGRSARRRGLALAAAAGALDAALLTDHEPLTEAEWRVVEQEAHLASTLASQARALHRLTEAPPLVA